MIEKDDLLRERAILLEEMQHRVANSLQIIASILLLKARKVTSEETREHLRDAHDRVLSIAAVQKHLEMSLGDVDIAPYLTKLCNSLADSMIGDSGRVTLEVHAGDATINSARHGEPGAGGHRAGDQRPEIRLPWRPARAHRRGLASPPSRPLDAAARVTTASASAALARREDRSGHQPDRSPGQATGRPGGDHRRSARCAHPARIAAVPRQSRSLIASPRRRLRNESRSRPLRRHSHRQRHSGEVGEGYPKMKKLLMAAVLTGALGFAVQARGRRPRRSRRNPLLP